MWELIGLILIIINIGIALVYSWQDRYDRATFYLAMAIFLMVGSIKH